MQTRNLQSATIRLIFPILLLLLCGKLIATEVDDGTSEGVAVLNALADRGDRDAHYRLGYLYLHGNRVLNPDISKAAKHYSEAHQLGHPEALRAAAFTYLQMDDYLFARRGALMLEELFQQQPDREISRSLGDFYAAPGNSYSKASALSWYRIAAEMGDKEAAFNSAVLLVDWADPETTDKESGAQAAAIFRETLKRNPSDGDAYNMLGILYKFGVGVDQNDEYALNLFEKASSYGSLRGAYNAGYAHYFGEGTKADVESALKHLKKAAPKLAEADDLMGVICSNWTNVCLNDQHEFAPPHNR